jgi:hypothetical protein
VSEARSEQQIEPAETQGGEAFLAKAPATAGKLRREGAEELPQMNTDGIQMGMRNGAVGEFSFFRG